jgi:quercetin dioxygenase-like cupin family protein
MNATRFAVFGNAVASSHLADADSVQPNRRPPCPNDRRGRRRDQHRLRQPSSLNSPLRSRHFEHQADDAAEGRRAGTNYETVTAIAEIAPGASSGRHTHPGPETGYVIEGEFTLLIDGQPAKALKAGDSYQIPASAVHDVKSSDKGMKVMAVYIVERGKPLASPAP